MGEAPVAWPEPPHEGFKIGPGSTHIELDRCTVANDAIHCPVGLGPAGQFAFGAYLRGRSLIGSCGSHAVSPK